jgi:hypothetical protein
MIPSHQQFIAAIQEKKKVSVRLYSKADSGVIDLVCAPLDYGLAGETQDGVNRYQLWDYSSNNGSHHLSLLPEQVLDLRVLGLLFDPAEFGPRPAPWSVARDWSSLPSPGNPPMKAAEPLPARCP